MPPETDTSSTDFERSVLQPLLDTYVSAQPEIELLRRAWAKVSASGDAALQRQAFDAARLLAELRADPEAMTAAVLAPVCNHSAESSLTDGDWPTSVIELVGLVNKLRGIRWHRIGDEAAETLRKMFLAMAQDVRVVLIVLALRVALMRALVAEADSGAEAEDGQDELAQETLDVFAPLANRLGIWQFKWELEDSAFQLLEPEVYRDLTRRLAETSRQRQEFVALVVSALVRQLDEAGIAAKVKGRAKHTFSIHNKMQRKGLSFEQLYDVSAVRIITKDLQSCYAALGVVHSVWVPVPNEFDDYIAMPKGNGYQSLHTVVMGPRGRPVEIQIRSEAMHEFAEFGVAAHWAYKEGKSAKKLAQDKFMLLRQLMDWEKELSDPKQFVQSMRTELFQDQVFVFTPNGDIVDLPVGATPLDFAYRIHTMVGHRCRGARVNDKMVSLDHTLKTGDRVEILTHKEPHPSRDWLNPAFGYLRTNSARNKVRLWFREQERDDAEQAGREVLTREFSHLGLKHANFKNVAAALKYKTLEELFAAVGYGDRSSQSVAAAALQIEREKSGPLEPPVPPSTPFGRTRAAAGGLTIGGVADIQGKRARCCRPVPGDRVIGFVTRGRGLIIHRTDCVNIVECDEPERLIEIDWGGTPDDKYTVEIKVRAEDRRGLLAELLQLLSYHGVDAVSAKTQPVRGDQSRDGEVTFRLTLQFRSADQLSHVTQKLAQHASVLEVVRAGAKQRA